jgi:hypothetical protein
MRLRLPAQHLRLRSKTTALIVGQLERASIESLLQDAVLFDQVRDHIRLMPVHPTGHGQ